MLLHKYSQSVIIYNYLIGDIQADQPINEFFFDILISLIFLKPTVSPASTGLRPVDVFVNPSVWLEILVYIDVNLLL